MENIKSIQANKYKIKMKDYDGKKHMVVPVVMMVEGVHSGSKGAIYHSEEELSKNPHLWNGIPVTINHPKNDSGFISANSPDVSNVGKIFNTNYDGKLKSEAWIDIEKIKEQSMEAYNYIKAQKSLDVSVGVFSDDIKEKGEWNGEEYEAKATNYKPDHLALLPGESGACSWNDGCGIRVNQRMEKEISNFLQTNKKSYTEIIRQITEKLREGESMKSPYIYHYCIEVYDDEVIYEKSEEEKGMKYYKQSYLFKDGEVEFVGEPTEVEKIVEFKNKISTNQKTIKIMSTEKSKCFISKVDNLIANEATKFQETDKDWLMEQTEDRLDKLVPKVQANREKVIEKELTEENVKIFLSERKLEDVVKLLPEDIQANVQSGLKLRDEKRKSMIEGIQANTADVWTKEELEVLSCEKLEKIAKSAKVEVADYSASVQVNTNKKEESGEEPLLPMDIDFAKN